MGTAVLSPFQPAQLSRKEPRDLIEPVKGDEPASEFLNRLESCDSMLRKIEARTALLAWTSSVVGLPISHISQVQNGAVLCYIVSVLCKKSDMDISQVNFLAVDESEYRINFKILQKVARKGSINGLNMEAKLRDWLRLARSRSDAWLFLDLLRKSFKEMGLGSYMVEIECDATPPPPPLGSKKMSKKDFDPKDVALMAGQWMERTSANNASHLVYREPTKAPLDIGSMVLDLADAWSRHDWEYKSEEADTLAARQGIGCSVSLDSVNASTRRAHSILKSLLQDDSSSMASDSRSGSEDLTWHSQISARSNSSASTISAKSLEEF